MLQKSQTYDTFPKETQTMFTKITVYNDAAAWLAG